MRRRCAGLWAGRMMVTGLFRLGSVPLRRGGSAAWSRLACRGYDAQRAGGDDAPLASVPTYLVARRRLRQHGLDRPHSLWSVHALSLYCDAVSDDRGHLVLLGS